MQTPLNRLSKFFSENEFDYYVDMAREHLSSVDTKILFIKVNKEKSVTDDLYGEGYTEELYFENPIEIPAIIELKPSKNEDYSGSGTIRCEEYGNLEVSFLLDDLEKYKADVSYGDYIGYRVDDNKEIYFEVANDARKAYDNQKTMFGYKPVWKTVLCTPTKKQFDLK